MANQPDIMMVDKHQRTAGDGCDHPKQWQDQKEGNLRIYQLENMRSVKAAVNSDQGTGSLHSL